MHRSSLHARFFCAGSGLALLFISACGGGGDGTGPDATPTVRSVTVSPSSVALRIGETQPLTSSVDASGGAATTVTWRSESPGVATVTAEGVVRAVAPGTAIVHATSTVNSAVSGSSTVTVGGPRSVTINPQSATMTPGAQRTFTASVDIEEGGNTTVSWRSSAPEIATVSQTGVVVAIANGTATITAVSVADTTVRGTSQLIVSVSVNAVTVSPTIATLNIGDTRQLNSTVVADPGANTSLMWRSSAPAVAVVSQSGLVTAVSPGTATITALSLVDTTKRGNANITVAARVPSVSIAQRSVNLLAGSTYPLTGTVTADPGFNTAITWSSSNPSTVSVSSQGVVSALALGSSLITATSVGDPTRRDTLTVSVVNRLATSWSAGRLGGAMYEDVLSIAPLGSGSAFAVNLLGDVFRWNGTTWTLSLRGSSLSTQFQAVDASSEDNVFAVGTNGVIARWNGSSWSGTTSGTTRTLYGVRSLSANSAYAVGANGTIVRWNGTSWSGVTSNSNATLYGITSVAGNTYAVGAGGEVLRFDASLVASRMTVPTTETLYAVSATSSNNIVAVGALGTVIRSDGTTWSQLNSGGFTDDLYAISAPAGARLYIAGDNGVGQVEGNTVSRVTTPYAPRMFTVNVDPAGGVWAGGQRGSVQRSQSGNWETVNLAPDLLDVWSTSATNAWAVGEFGFVYRWNGTTWTRQSTPTTSTLVAVWGIGANDAFAAGDNGAMLRWNGTAWTSMTFPSTASVLALWGSAANNVYAVTEAGEIVRYNGTTWSVVATASRPLWTIWGSGPNQIYAAGENGAVMRYDGTSWTPFTSPGEATLAGIWQSGPDNVITVGADGTGTAGVTYRHNGNAWSMLPVGTSRVLTSVWGPSLLDLHVTGEEGVMLRYNGSTWAPITTGSNEFLWAVSGPPSGGNGAFAVGYNGTVISNVAGAIAAASLRVGRESLDPAPGARGIGTRRPLPAGARRSSRDRR